jgi:hypothetical protein
MIVIIGEVVDIRQRIYSDFGIVTGAAASVCAPHHVHTVAEWCPVRGFGILLPS